MIYGAPFVVEASFVDNLIVMYDDEMVKNRYTSISVMSNVVSAWHRLPSISFEYGARNQPPSDLNRLGAEGRHVPTRTLLLAMFSRRGAILGSPIVSSVSSLRSLRTDVF